MSVTPKDHTKDPDAALVYQFDWSAWLTGAAMISTQQFIVTGPDSALTFDNAAIAQDGKSVSVRLLGGTVNTAYQITNRITTNESPQQIDDRTVKIKIRQK